MRMVDLIEKKRDGGVLTDDEIRFIIKGFTDGSIPDYQMSAFAMTVFYKGMTDHETAVLTDAMMRSGDTVDLSRFGDKSVDKHSTGGVGDKTTLIVAPIVSSLGGKMAKMSGRGLGHTGGTLDKLESIPGFNINLPMERFLENVDRVGMVIAGQTANLDPADKKLYALRDVTGTVDCLPLVVSSILSKKIAAGADVIVCYMHWGKEYEEMPDDNQKKLANILVASGCDVIVGGHPHVVQYATWLSGTNQFGEAQQTLCLYSLGNFLSDQRLPLRDGGILFDFTIQEQADGSFSIINPSYLPTWVWRTGDKENGYDYSVVPIGKYLDTRPEGMSDADYTRMLQSYQESINAMQKGNAGTLIAD